MPHTSPKLIDHRKPHSKLLDTQAASSELVEILPLWQLNIAELTGHNLEARGREEVIKGMASGVNVPWPSSAARVPPPVLACCRDVKEN